MNKKSLSLKKPPQLQMPDAPFTPVDQTVHTPLEVPHASYFPAPSLYSISYANESDDILTDVDEPSGKVMRNYSVSFTPAFDLLMMGIYSHILSLPTTTPFLGVVPPLGLVSRVANETIYNLIRNTADGTAPVYDTQGVLNHDHLKSHEYQPIILQLIRKRLLDMCALQLRTNQPPVLPLITSVLMPVLQLAVSFTSNHSVYSGLGLRQLSISNLLLNELNLSSMQAQQPALVAQVAALNSRLHLSSLSLRKHSLTRNNSYSGLNWLHVGNVQNVRPNTLGMNPEFAASNDSLQLMNDYVPQAILARLGNLLVNLSQSSSSNWCPTPGFNSMMLDYQTPPTSVKSSVLLGSTPPLTGHRDNILAGSADYDEFTNQLTRARSSSRGNTMGLFPKPLTINTDASNFLLSMNAMGSNGGANSYGLETLNSPFLSAATPSEDVACLDTSSASGSNGLSGIALKSGPLVSESLCKDTPMANGNNKINLPGQFSLSEKKRDSLKLKRGIH